MLLALIACEPAGIPLGEEPAVGDPAVEDILTHESCEPGGADVSVVEGDQAAVTVGCLGGGTAESFDMPSLPNGASFDADARTLTWTTDLADAGRHDLVVVSHGEGDESGLVTVWVADAWDAPDNEPVDPVTYTYEFGLPVFHIDEPPGINESEEVPTTLVYRGVTHQIGLKYRGAASLYYPKNSYTVKFAADDEFEDDDEGFDDRHDITLTTTFDDNSYLRNALCYELWNALDEERHAIQTMFAVVYVDGAYEGLYLVTDHIDGEYWEDQGYVEDGNLYKAVSHDANFYDNYSGAPKRTWHDGFEQKEGTSWQPLDDFSEWAATSGDDEFAAGLGDRIVEDELIDWWILVRYTEGDDSGGKNAYLYYDDATGLFHHAPWDFNHSLGQTWQTEREAASTDYDFFWSNNLFKRAFDDPQRAPVWAARMQAALDGPLATAAVDARIDDHLARIGPSAARDWEKWESTYRGYSGWSWRTDWTDHDGEIAYLREWVADRHGYVDGWY